MRGLGAPVSGKKEVELQDGGRMFRNNGRCRNL
jgi:hypothetical protein